jgi:hypothetical protein
MYVLYMCVYVFIYEYVFMHVYNYVYVCNVCMYVCVYMHVCVYVYIYTHTCIHTYIHTCMCTTCKAYVEWICPGQVQRHAASIANKVSRLPIPWKIRKPSKSLATLSFSKRILFREITERMNGRGDDKAYNLYSLRTECHSWFDQIFNLVLKMIYSFIALFCSG